MFSSNHQLVKKQTLFAVSLLFAMNRRVSSQVAAAPGGDIIEPDAKMRTRGRALQDVTNSNLQTANTKDNKVVSRKVSDR